jgi:CheY-like chemotaxis protein
MKQYRIIIVENDEDEQVFVVKGFQASGLFQIISVHRNGDELIEWLEDHPHHDAEIILSDLNMPGKNGYDIIRYIRNHPRFAPMPVIITSTSSAQTIIDKCIETGASFYLIKPETFNRYESFARELHRLIEEKQFV